MFTVLGGVLLAETGSVDAGKCPAGLTACLVVRYCFPYFSGMVGFASVYAMSLSGLFQYMVRQSAQVETQMTSVERILHYATRLPQEEEEAELAASTGKGVGDKGVGDKAVGDKAVGDKAVGDKAVGDKAAAVVVVQPALKRLAPPNSWPPCGALELRQLCVRYRDETSNSYYYISAHFLPQDNLVMPA